MLTNRLTAHAGRSVATSTGPVASTGSGRLMIPVSDGVGVYDPTTGVNERFIPLRRQPAQSAVVPAVAGSVLLEQRGGSLVALGG